MLASCLIAWVAHVTYTSYTLDSTVHYNQPDINICHLGISQPEKPAKQRQPEFTGKYSK